MTQINGTNNIGKVNVNISISNNSNDVSTKTVGSTFGDGFGTTAVFGVEKNIAGLAALLQSGKFDFEPPVYPKGGFAQFNPTDADYNNMKHLDVILDKPEEALAEA